MTFEQVENLENILINTLGEQGLFDEILASLGVDEKEELYQWIARMYDIEY